MRGIAIPWSKDDISKKKLIFYFLSNIFLLKKKKETKKVNLNPKVVGQGWSHHPWNASGGTTEAFQGWCDHPRNK